MMHSHPTISAFPRQYFYHGLLEDGENVKQVSYDKPYHHLAPAFQPLVFWNLVGSRETTKTKTAAATTTSTSLSSSSSKSNQMEIDMAVNLYFTLKQACPPDMIRGKVGVITPYAQQMEELKKAFARACSVSSNIKQNDSNLPHLYDYSQDVEINTVDGHQNILFE
jgi:senataxin